MLQVLFSDNLSDNLAITICCTRFSGKDFNNFRKEIKGHECKMKGKCVQMKGRWEDMNAHWNENETNMKGTWMEMNTNERTMTGQWREMNAQWKEDACKWKENEGKCLQINATPKEHEVLPKHLKPTKQLFDPFPGLFRNGFWLRVGSRICWCPQNLLSVLSVVSVLSVLVLVLSVLVLFVCPGTGPGPVCPGPGWSRLSCLSCLCRMAARIYQNIL